MNFGHFYCSTCTFVAVKNLCVLIKLVEGRCVGCNISLKVCVSAHMLICEGNRF